MPAGDLLVHAGDFTLFGKSRQKFQKGRENKWQGNAIVVTEQAGASSEKGRAISDTQGSVRKSSIRTIAESARPLAFALDVLGQARINGPRNSTLPACTKDCR
jgi:hypothetical protein